MPWNEVGCVRWAYNRIKKEGLKDNQQKFLKIFSDTKYQFVTQWWKYFTLTCAWIWHLRIVDAKCPRAISELCIEIKLIHLTNFKEGLFLMLDLPVSPDRSYNFTCFSSFVRLSVRQSIRPFICFWRVSLRIDSLAFSDFLHRIRGL